MDSATARLIADYIGSLNTLHAAEGLKLFQPGGSQLSSDVAFAVDLFGQDAWPTSMTASQLRGIDPLRVRIALPLPIWSDEGSNLDWMPDDPLPPAILSYAGNAAATALASYNAAPTTQNLLTAVTKLYEADHASANAGAPCLFFVASRVNYEQCFEVRRWTSSLVAQHMLRNGISRPIGTLLHNIWWEVGTAARHSNGNPGEIANAVPNWTRWMYVGWMFDPAGIAAVYTVQGLRKSGLPRHATFVALRSLVSRPPASVDEDLTVWIDFKEFAGAVPASWAFAAANLALRHLLDRLNSGDRPPAGTASSLAIAQVNGGMDWISPKVTAAEFATLRALADQVIAKL